MAKKGSTGRVKKSPVKQTKEQILDINKKIEEMGQEDEAKGISAAKKFIAEYNEETRAKDEIKIEKLDKLSKKSGDKYFNQLSGLLNDEVQDMKLAERYVAWSEYTSEGIILRLKGPKGNFYRAFKPSMEARIDFEAVVGLLIQLQDQIDLELYEKAESLKDMGFVLPS